MNQKNTIFTAVFLAAGALAASVTGCELIASVDRGLIAGSGGSGGHGGGTGGTTVSSTTTSTASGTGGGTGGAMCAGGASMCANPQACPDPMNECVIRTCAMSCCGKSNVANGIATMNGQTSGDCMKQVCDGNGATMMAVDITDVPANMDDCHTGACTAAGAPSQTPDALGTVCTSSGGKVCADPAGTSAGKCVACNVSADCASGKSCNTASNTCVAVGCTNGIKDGNETGVDCGGSCGATCNDGTACVVNGDCLNTYCKAGICAAPSCTDAVLDGNETDTDCGGTGYKGAGACPRCADTKKCALSVDCANGFCDLTVTPHVCKTPTCTDGQSNGKETGVDCGGGPLPGGSGCPACAVGMTCANATDCTSGFCKGGTCALKPQGMACGAAAECSSTFCADGFCCNSACTSGCSTCSAGVPGTCSSVAAGNNSVAGKTTCATTLASTCGTDGKCDGAGSCQDYTAATTCAAAACVGSTLTASSHCSGAGACNPGAASSCGLYACNAGGTACNTTCSVTSDCSMGNYCNGGMCVAQQASGGACTQNNACTTGICGTAGMMGNCCAVACSTADATCGATACAAVTGACTYPPAATSCGANSCTGSTLATHTCSGTGTCGATSAACPANLTCNAGGTACQISCGMASPTGDMNCVTGFYCDGTGAGSCQGKKAMALPCTRNGECTNGTCAGTPLLCN